MNDENIIYSVMNGGYISCHTNGKIYKNYDEFKKEMLCYYGKEELINIISNLQSKIDKANELIKIEKEKMGYAKYDSCLLLIEKILKEDKYEIISKNIYP